MSDEQDEGGWGMIIGIVIGGVVVLTAAALFFLFA